MNKTKRWSSTEVETLKEQIKLHKDNVTAAYKATAQMIGRSADACKQKALSLHVKSTKRWTDEEDAILIKNIKECNLRKEAFQKTSKATGRPVSACATRWYTKVSLRGDKESVCFGTVFTNKSLINRTRETNKVSATPRKKSWWEKILKMLGF